MSSHEIDMTDAVILSERIEFRDSKERDALGNPCGTSVILTFHGKTLIDGETIPDGRLSAAIPTSQFGPLLASLTDYAFKSGHIVAPPAPRLSCGSEYIRSYSLRGATTPTWQVFECMRRFQHPGRHVNGSHVWDDTGAAGAAAAFDAETEPRGNCTRCDARTTLAQLEGTSGLCATCEH